MSHTELSGRVYDALAAGKAERQDDRWAVHYAGNCTEPIEVPAYSSPGALFSITRVRCRKCANCLRAKQFFWARTAMDWTKRTHEAGLRTWFGTLTFKPGEQQEALLLAREAHPTPNAAWWDESLCDERFAFVRKQMVGMIQRYWKRLRKGVKRCHSCYPKGARAKGEWDHPPAKFKYFVVFERHQSGLPHLHWLLHEANGPILLKQLACAWPHGFTKVKLVSGDDISKAGFYVSKYLGKNSQARQIASVDYASRQKRPLRGK